MIKVNQKIKVECDSRKSEKFIIQEIYTTYSIHTQVFMRLYLVMVEERDELMWLAELPYDDFCELTNERANYYINLYHDQNREDDLKVINKLLVKSKLREIQTSISDLQVEVPDQGVIYYDLENIKRDINQICKRM